MSFSMFQEGSQGGSVLIKATLMKESLMIFTESCKNIEKTGPIDLITLACYETVNARPQCETENFTFYYVERMVYSLAQIQKKALR